MRFRRIRHGTRNMWITSWFASERCKRPELKAFLEKLESTGDTLRMEGLTSGSSQHIEMDESCCKTDSPYNVEFEYLADVPQKKMHYQVEKLLIHERMNVVATEVPLKTPTAEGLIDVLAEGPNHIWVMDYKPNAHRENAFGQVSWYATLLSQLTDIPLEDFRVAWFDGKTCWHGKPVKML